MAVLRIFGDEAGTMPQDDDGQIFTTATVSILGGPPIINKPNGHREWLIEQLKILKAIPHVAYVKPKHGYGNAIKNKFDKVDVMARMTRLITGSNTQYLTQKGVKRLRNLIWTYCMNQTIAQAVVLAISRDKIDRVKIVLDQKTMDSDTKKLFISQIQLKRNQLTVVLEQLIQMNKMYPQQVTAYELFKSRLRFSPETISLCWSDESCAQGSEGGLRLADYLASHSRRELFAPGETKIKKFFSEEGFSFLDLTDKLMEPLNPEVIKKWERNTWLREPK